MLYTGKAQISCSCCFRSLTVLDHMQLIFISLSWFAALVSHTSFHVSFDTFSFVLLLEDNSSICALPCHIYSTFCYPYTLLTSSNRLFRAFETYRSCRRDRALTIAELGHILYYEANQ
jgi:hypothetical protein